MKGEGDGLEITKSRTRERNLYTIFAQFTSQRFARHTLKKSVAKAASQQVQG